MGLSATLPARPDPHGPSVGACRATGQGFPCCAHSPLPCVLPPIPRRNLSVRVSLASRQVAAFPVIRAGRLPRHTLSRPARRSLALRPAWLLNRPWRPVTSECSRQCRYLHHPLRLLPAGATVAGRDSHPLKNGALHGAPDKAGYVASGGLLSLEERIGTTSAAGELLFHVSAPHRPLRKSARLRAHA